MMKYLFKTIGAVAVFSVLVVLSMAGIEPAYAAHMSSPEAMGSLAFGGLLVNKDSLNRIFTGLKTIFNNTLRAQTGTWQTTAMEVPSSGEGEDYAWMSRFPKFRKWVDEKVVKNLKLNKYYKANEDWETTIAVKRNHIEDDRLGIYNTQSQQAGEAAGELNDIIVDDLKNNAFTATGIDGQYFYDIDHPVGNASVSNKGVKKLSSATKAAAIASYGAARTAIMNLKDDEGMSLRLVPDVLEVPPALEAVARTLVEADKLDDNSPNPFHKTAKVLVNPALTSQTAWMLHVTNKASVKPFIIQMRKKPVFVSQVSSENDDVFMRAEFKFGAEARATGLYGYWQLSYGSDGSVA